MKHRKNKVASEATGIDIIRTGRISEPYKSDNGNRFTNRVQAVTEPGKKEWQLQDMNKLFNTGDFLFHLPVKGNTDSYVVKLEAQDFLNLLKQEIKSGGFSVTTFRSALVKALDSKDVKVSCSCPDFTYRLSYWVSQSNTNSGIPQNIRAEKTNPNDKAGRGCKHILYCLSNKQWADQVARNLFNYIVGIYRSNKTLFNKLIAPKLDLTDDVIANRPIRGSNQNNPVNAPKSNDDANSNIASQTTQTLQGGAEEALRRTRTVEGYYGEYYSEANFYDDTQTMMLQIANDLKINLEKYVTPKNSPEQMNSLLEAMQLYKLKDEQIQVLADADLPYTHIDILALAYSNNIDLSKYTNFNSKVLKQLYRAETMGFPVEKFAIQGYNDKQIEQLISAYKLNPSLYSELHNNRYNYEQMRREIIKYKGEHSRQ